MRCRLFADFSLKTHKKRQKNPVIKKIELYTTVVKSNIFYVIFILYLIRLFDLNNNNIVCA